MHLQRRASGISIGPLAAWLVTIVGFAGPLGLGCDGDAGKTTVDAGKAPGDGGACLGYQEVPVVPIDVDTAACAPLGSCDADVTGSWTFTQDCQGLLLTPAFRCSNSDYPQRIDAQPTGSLALHADGTYELMLTEKVVRHYAYPSACNLGTEKTCSGEGARLDAVLKKAFAGDPALSDLSYVCQGSCDCSCDEGHTRTVQKSGQWSAPDGGTLTTTSRYLEGLGWSVCVHGDQIRLSREDSSSQSTSSGDGGTKVAYAETFVLLGTRAAAQP